MIKEKKLLVKIVNKTIKKFRNFGYDCNLNDEILIKIEHISLKSHIKITGICDICKHEQILTYQSYNNNFNKYNLYTCHKCSSFKNKLTCQKKHNNKTFNNREKCKKTNLEKYGFENVFQNDKIKNTILLTNNKKYNCDYPQQNKNILNKSIKTNNEKYNCDRPAQNPIFIKKMKNTKKEKYNNENYNNIIKIKNTVFEKYGIDNVSQLSDHKEKIQMYYNDKMLIKYPFITNIDYINKKYTGYCNKNHIYIIDIDLFHNRLSHNIDTCTICYPENSLTSDKENKLLEFIKENYTNKILCGDRKILNGKELDIYLPDLKLAFEFNGLFWHSEIYKEKNYHFDKTKSCEEQNIKLIQIYEDDWIFKQEIVKSRILNLLGKTPNKIYARKCEIKETTDNKLVRNFLNENHLQGFVGSQIKLCLFYNNELVSLMTFGSKRKFMKQNNTDGVYEMLRFCSKLNTSIVGGAEKLFKYFIENYKPKEVISYADRSWSQGELYKKLGFTFVNKTPPNYYYVIEGVRKHRFGFRKDILIKQGFNPNKTEHQIMADRNIYKIYDSGSLKFNYKTCLKIF